MRNIPATKLKLVILLMLFIEVKTAIWVISILLCHARVEVLSGQVNVSLYLFYYAKIIGIQSTGWVESSFQIRSVYLSSFNLALDGFTLTLLIDIVLKFALLIQVQTGPFIFLHSCLGFEKPFIFFLCK